MALTDKQRDYIDYMLTNDYTDRKDQRALDEVLRETGRASYTELTKSEASRLITRLIERDVVYTFVCGEKKTVERWEAHSFDTFGDAKACTNHCPKDQYIGSCEAYQAHEQEMDEDMNDE